MCFSFTLSFLSLSHSRFPSTTSQGLLRAGGGAGGAQAGRDGGREGEGRHGWSAIIGADGAKGHVVFKAQKMRFNFRWRRTQREGRPRAS